MIWIIGLTLLSLYFVITTYLEGNYRMVLFWAEVTVVIGAVAIFIYKEEKKSTDFLKWLVNNALQIKNGAAQYNGKLIKQTTETTQFQACFSFLVLSTKSPSRFFIRGHDNTILMGTIYTIITLIFGWWGIPWGPIYTLETLYRNATGGHKQVVGDMLLKIEQAAMEQNKEIETKAHDS